MGLEVVAHQGGWDEALLVAGPLLLFAGIVWNAKRRAVRQSQTSAGEDHCLRGDAAHGGTESQARAGEDG